MRTWIFQGNPDEYDIDGYLASRPAQLFWLVTRHASEIATGDRVYLWRNQGTQRAVSGIIAEAIVTAAPGMRVEDPEGIRFWRVAGPRGDAPQMRAVMRLVKVANNREVLRRNWLMEDPVLRELPNLRMGAGTNYPLSHDQAQRLEALWGRTGRDWTRNEAVAGLWAYAETYNLAVSSLPGSPVSRIALLIGRAVSGVYAKVMNFRSLDPRAEGDGMSGASETDRIVWREFFDAGTSTLRNDALHDEFERLWTYTQSDGGATPQAREAAAIVEEEAGRLEELTLEVLRAKYAAQASTNSQRPRTRVSSTRTYERNPLVIAIARKRASHRCEVLSCDHSSFETVEGIPYTEVHHIVPLASGGDDIIENVACLCPIHHREVHLGRKSLEITAQLKAARAA